MNTSLIERFAPVLCGPDAPVVRDPTLLMDASGPMKVYYAPFEYINPSTQIVLVGISPGPTKVVNANNEARRVLLAGKSNGDAIQAAKSVGVFSGEPLRSNLINQLKHWGFHKWLGLDSAELFEKDAGVLRHSKSCSERDLAASSNPFILRRYNT